MQVVLGYPHSFYSISILYREYSCLVIEIFSFIPSFSALIHPLYLYSISTTYPWVPYVRFFLFFLPPSPFTLSLFAAPLSVSPRVLKSDRTGLTAALRYRFTGPVRPVTGGNRLNSNSNKFKNSHATGSDRFTGRFYRFEIQKLPCNWFTGRFDRFTGRFDRFTKWALMGRPIFFLFFGLTSNSRKVC